jgi:GNAT superfamily N-acetyltransferase
MEIPIREARLDDLPHLVHHRRAMFEDMGHRDPAILDRVDRASREYFTRALQDATYKAWLAERPTGEILAGSGIVLAPWPGHPSETLPQRAWILNMYTEPHARRQGLARRILQIMADWCRANGFASVSLHASPAARSLYESLGFQPTNEMRLTLR